MDASMISYYKDLNLKRQAETALKIAKELEQAKQSKGYKYQQGPFRSRILKKPK